MSSPRLKRILMPMLVVLLLLGIGGLWLLKHQIVGLDSQLNAFLSPWRRAPLLDIFLWLTSLGAAPAVTMAAVVATGFLAAGRQGRAVVALWLAFLGETATTWTIKYLIGRARPEFIDAASAVSPSFPSAHSSSAIAVYGFLGFVIAQRFSAQRFSAQRFSAQRFSQGHIRAAIMGATAVVILLIGFSRLLLSVHYLTDVLGGFAIGGAWLLVALGISRAKLVRP